MIKIAARIVDDIDITCLMNPITPDTADSKEIIDCSSFQIIKKVQGQEYATSARENSELSHFLKKIVRPELQRERTNQCEGCHILWALYGSQGGNCNLQAISKIFAPTKKIK